MQNIYERSAILKEMIEHNEIAMVGAVYDVQSGVVEFKDYEQELKQLNGKNNAQLASKLNELLREANIKK